MELIKFDKKTVFNNRICVCIGNFDGVHLGHKYVISSCVEYAKRNNILSAIVTFEHNVSLSKINILSSNLKYEMLSKLGIDVTFIVDFNEDFVKTSYIDFEKYYLANLDIDSIYLGVDFKYGNKALGNSKTLSESYNVKILEFRKVGASKISSSSIRKFLQKGNLRKASKMLGYYPLIEGTVIKGRGLGKQMFVPTINLDLSFCKDLYRKGVYQASVEIDNKLYNGIANIGVAPTMKNDNDCYIEVNLFDVENIDLYDKKVLISLIDFIREEKHFESATKLAKAISNDIKKLKERLKKYE